MVTPTHRCALRTQYKQIYTGTCKVHIRICTKTHMYIKAHTRMNVYRDADRELLTLTQRTCGFCSTPTRAHDTMHADMHVQVRACS